MNKQKFVDYLRSPERLTEGQFEELQKLLTDYPYFSIAKSIAARGAKDLNIESKNQFISSAAIYATDRKHLKKYINGELVFLAEPPKITEDVVVQSEKKSSPQQDKEKSSSGVLDSDTAATASTPSSKGEEIDQVLDELQRDIKELEKARTHFLEVQDHIDEVKFTSKSAPEKEEQKPSEDAKAIPEPSVSTASGFEDKKQTAKEDVADDIEDEVPKKAPTEFKLDLEALKREFALEADSQKEIPKPLDRQPKIIDNMDEDDDEDDADFFPPPPTDAPNAITNMSPDEEEPDDEAEIIQKIPQKSKRKPRKATKMKRDDFEKILGKKPEISSSPAENEIKEEAVEDIEVKEEVSKPKKTTGVNKEAKKVSKPKREAKNKKTEINEEAINEDSSRKVANIETDDKVKEAMAKLDKASSVSKSKSKRDGKKSSRKDPDANPSPIEIVKSVPKKVVKGKTNKKNNPKVDDSEELTERKSVKSFLELGRSKESTSISRASSRRRGRTTKSSGDSPKSGKDDDESGGASSLIDKFIAENPSIQRRDNTDEKSDLSEESVKWHPELASEYLAQIYSDQGNKTRAISIYEALSLKFPEKKSYFAGLIKKLKK